jgi:hypothetical protein
MDTQTFILLLAPVVVIQVALQVYCLRDIYVRGGAKGNTVLWVVVVLVGQLLGPILYLTLGRKEEVVES